MATTPNKDKMIKIKLPRSRDTQEDVYVAVNGKSFLIKRGETVEVPEYVLEVLDNRDAMIAEAIEFEAQASAKAEQ